MELSISLVRASLLLCSSSLALPKHIFNILPGGPMTIEPGPADAGTVSWLNGGRGLAVTTTRST